MDDLRQRFASLDRLRTPDLWDEIELRAAALGSAERLTPISVPVPVTSRRHDRRSLVVWVVAVALIAALLAGAISVGGTLLRLRTALPAPSALGCANIATLPPEASDTRWANAPARGPLSEAAEGPILAEVRTGLETPPRDTPWTRIDLVLVDPVSGSMCTLVETSEIEQANPGEPPLGQFSAGVGFSAGGDALAIVHDGTQLAVLTPDGLANVLPDAAGDSLLPINQARLSPDGSMVAIWAGEPLRLLQDGWEIHPQEIGIVLADGSTTRWIAFDCDSCAQSNPIWSPDQTRIALQYWRVHEADPSAEKLIAIADVSTGASEVLENDLTDLELVGWRDDETLLGVDAGRRLVAIPVARPGDYETLAEYPITLGQDGALDETYSPDLTKVAYVEWLTDPDTTSGRLAGMRLWVMDLDRGETRLVGPVIGPLPVHIVWSPDSRRLAWWGTEDVDQSIGGRLWIADADGSNPHSIDRVLVPVAWQPAWP